MSEIRKFLLKCTTPVYYFCENSAVLTDVYRSFPNLHHVNYYDIWDGHNPYVTAVNNPIDEEARSFKESADCSINLMSRQQTRDLIQENGGGGKALFFHIDERSQAAAQKIGLDMILPSSELRNLVDSKVQTTLIGNRAGVPSVPNVLVGPLSCYEDLVREAGVGGLGSDLVVQLPYGCGGDTTFFIANSADWDKFSARITPEKCVKVMKRIRCQASAQEACVTKQGTIVGPLMTELIGFPELTPVRGGWCGNEVAAESFTAQQRQLARQYTERFGQELLKEGYRGYFEIDYLWDLDTGELFLGELNPRISGAAPMTNSGLLAKADLPLICFHILEWLDVPFELDISALNDRWCDTANEEDWSQCLVMKTDHDSRGIISRPKSGVYRLTPEGTIKFLRPALDRSSVSHLESANEFFYTCELPHKTAEYWDFLGTVTLRGRMLTRDNQLNDRVKLIQKAIRDSFEYAPL